MRNVVIVVQVGTNMEVLEIWDAMTRMWRHCNYWSAILHRNLNTGKMWDCNCEGRLQNDAELMFAQHICVNQEYD